MRTNRCPASKPNLPRLPGHVRSLALLTLLFSACAPAAYVSAPFRESKNVTPFSAEQAEAYKKLSSNEGPARFALVSPGIYRGGQPSKRHLEQLNALGVKTVINLRREGSGSRKAEAAQAHRLGMRFLHFPFYGIFGLEGEVVDRILDDVKKGQVYIHCLNGRDRTSLMVALYRAQVEKWDPKVAWKMEALDYGHRETFFYRGIRGTFHALTSKLKAAVKETAKAAAKATAPAGTGTAGPAATAAAIVAAPISPATATAAEAAAASEVKPRPARSPATAASRQDPGKHEVVGN